VYRNFRICSRPGGPAVYVVAVFYTYGTGHVHNTSLFKFRCGNAVPSATVSSMACSFGSPSVSDKPIDNNNHHDHHAPPPLLLLLMLLLLLIIITTRKAVVARRYLRQGKAIRQVASPSSLCQRFPYAPLTQW